jgi:hypothetical protein
MGFGAGEGLTIGQVAVMSSLMVCTPAQPMVWVFTNPSCISAFNASWTVHRL